MTISGYLNLKNIDLDIRKGEFVCIVGSVGSGKSSLLNVINGNLIFVRDELANGQNAQIKREREFFYNFFKEIAAEALTEAPV